MSKKLAIRPILLLVTILAFVVSGCVSSKTSGNIAAFGTATKGVTDKINTVIKDYNDALIQNELTEIAQSRSRFQINSFDSIEDILIKEAEKKNYDLYKATQALGAYAKALSELANAGSREQIDLAATKLYGSLNGMNEQYKAILETQDDLIPNETSSLISRVIAEIGSYYIERKRNKALKEIIPAANGPIQIICDVIEKELLKGAMERRLYTMKHTELYGYISDYNDIVAIESFEKKRAILSKVYEKYLEMQSSSASIQTATKAIRAIKKAHNTLNNDLMKGEFSSGDIVKAIGELKNIHDHYDDLEELMLSCDTEIIADPNKGIICKPKE